MKTLVAWRGGLFLTEGKIGVLSVSSLFSTRMGVYVGVCVYTHTHTHTAHMGYSDVSHCPGVRIRHLEGPTNPDGLNLGTHVFAGREENIQNMTQTHEDRQTDKPEECA